MKHFLSKPKAGVTNCNSDMQIPIHQKNCKATILDDTIQLLKDVAAQVNKLKGEHSLQAEESQEVIPSYPLFLCS